MKKLKDRPDAINCHSKKDAINEFNKLPKKLQRNQLYSIWHLDSYLPVMTIDRNFAKKLVETHNNIGRVAVVLK